MAIATKNVHNALVFYDDASTTERWFDAFGVGVVKYLQEFVNLPMDDTTTDPTEWVVTVVEIGAGTSNAILSDTAGGALVITAAANEDDGWSMQLGGAAGETVSLASDYPLYFEITFQGNDVDQSDFLFGLAVTDTAILGGVTDGVYFRSVDGSAVLNFVLEKDSVESVTAVGTLTDATDVTCSFYFDGVNIIAAVDDVQQASIARTDASFPNDELLRLSVEFLTGEAVANTCTIKSLRLIQIVA
jgi:hypothetical protein